MKFNYPKSEKLKRKKTIDLLFSEGKSVSKYPLRLVYVRDHSDTCSGVKIGFSVSKRYFKNAVDRNYIKRILRESYRTNKHIVARLDESGLAMMILYQSPVLLTQQEIEEKTIRLMQKFLMELDGKDQTVP